MSSAANNQTTHAAFSPQESSQTTIWESPTAAAERVENTNVDHAKQGILRERTPTPPEVSPDDWPGTRFTPIIQRQEERFTPQTYWGVGEVPSNPGRIRTPPTAQISPPPRTPTSAEIYFNREIRRETRAARVLPHEGDLDGQDAWLAPDFDTSHLNTISREMRRGILMRDALNRVARRPSAQAPGGVPIGAGPRDTSPTPAPRRQRCTTTTSRVIPKEISQPVAVPPRPAASRGPVRDLNREWGRVRSSSVERLTQQLDSSAVRDSNSTTQSETETEADDDIEMSDTVGVHGPPGTAEQVPLRVQLRMPFNPANHPNICMYPNSQTLVVPGQVPVPHHYWHAGPGGPWGLGYIEPQRLSSFDSAYGTWTGYQFGIGAHLHNGFEPGWSGYTRAVPASVYPAPTHVQQHQQHPHQYPHQYPHQHQQQYQHQHQYPPGPVRTATVNNPPVVEEFKSPLETHDTEGHTLYYEYKTS